MKKTEERIAYFKKKGVKFLDAMPDGWRFLHGATTAPCGYVWVHNCKNPFTKGRRTALLKR